MPRPRIAHVINSIGLGGVPEAAYQLLRTLPRQRYEQRLYVLKTPDPSDDNRMRLRERFHALDVPMTVAAPATHRLSPVSALTDWLMAERIDLLHCHSYKPNIYARLAGALLRPQGLRIVAHYHNHYDANWQRDGTLSIDRQLAHQTDAFIAVSESVRAHLLDRLKAPIERITTIPNGVDFARFQAGGSRSAARRALGLRPEQSVITLVGRLSAQKGQEDLIRAMPAILAAVPDVVLLLAGAPDDPATQIALEALSADLNVTRAIRFSGFVTDMTALYAATDLLVAPSRWEGFGLMLVEAMAAGVPIVATRVGAIPEVVSENETALLVPPADPAAIANAVVSLLKDPVRARRLGDAGRERAKLFSWERAAQSVDAVYGRVLARSSEALR